MQVVDHTHHSWVHRVTRINGAVTYSQDLVKFQIPKWAELLGPNDIISTCPKFSETRIAGQFDTAIQYLHTYPYTNDVGSIKTLINQIAFKYKRIIFITAYKEFETKLNKAGIRAVFAPMAINAAKLREHKHNPIYGDKNILWFGNFNIYKRPVFTMLQRRCRQLGLTFDYIANETYNGVITKQPHPIIAQYKYGIAVGRCALEMQAIGLKVFIAGREIGGLITNPGEYLLQQQTNMNGRINTYSSDPIKCIRDIDLSIVKSNDIMDYNHAEMTFQKYAG